MLNVFAFDLKCSKITQWFNIDSSRFKNNTIIFNYHCCRLVKKKAKKSKQKKLNYNFKVKVNKTYELNIILFADYTKQK